MFEEQEEPVSEEEDGRVPSVQFCNHILVDLGFLVPLAKDGQFVFLNSSVNNGYCMVYLKRKSDDLSFLDNFSNKITFLIGYF